MGKRQLLFVTYGDANLEEGVAYAIELAKAMVEDIAMLLLLKRKEMMTHIENLMTVVTPEEGIEPTGMADRSVSYQDASQKILTGLVERCQREGLRIAVTQSDQDPLTGIRTYLENHTDVDKVVLSPAVTGSDGISTKELSRLVRTASRPIVTMTRHAYGAAC